MDANYLLEKLGEDLKIELALSSQNTCSVNFDDDEVIFEENSRHLYILSVIGSATGRDGICKSLLQANYLGIKTGNASICLDENTDEILLYKSFVGSLDYQDFQDELVMFIKAVRFWKKWLDDPENAKEQLINENQKNTETLQDMIKNGMQIV